MKEYVHVSRAIHSRAFLKHTRRQAPCKVSIAVASVCRSPKVTVDKGRGTHGRELSNSVHFWHVTHSVVALPMYTDNPKENVGEPVAGLVRARACVWCLLEDNGISLGSLVSLPLSCHIFTHKPPKLSKQFAIPGKRVVSRSQRVI